MRTAALYLGLTLLAAAPLACGAAPVAPAASKPTVVAAPAAAPPPAIAVAPPLDLSPVAEPDGLIGVVRWKSPNSTISTGASWSGLPPQVVTASSQMAVEQIMKEALRNMADPAQLSALVALDAPIDGIAALDPNPRRRDAIGAMSIGLVSLERAKQAAEVAAPLRELAPGMWKIGDRRGSNGTCVIAASAGATPARLVCGPHDKDVLALGPYLARTMPTLSVAAVDLHAELRITPIEARYGGLLRQTLSQAPLLAQSQISIDDPRFDRAVVEAATALSDEVADLAGDLDKVSFDLGLDARAGLTTTGSLQLRARKSWLAQTVTDRPERAGPPPAMFWRLPNDSESAVFGRGVDPARYTAIFRTLRTLLESGLAKASVGTEADRKALADLIAMPLGKNTSSVQASGHVATPEKTAKTTPQQELDALIDSYLGWHVLGVDEGPDALAKWLKDLVNVYNRRSLLALVRKEMGDDAKMLPTIKSVPAPASLGRGALDIEIKVSGIPGDAMSHGDDSADRSKLKAKTLSASVHILLMADGQTTWLALGTSRDALTKRLLSLKGSAPGDATLATRRGLEALKSGANMSGGFVTLASVTNSLPRLLSSMDEMSERDGKKFGEAILRMPNRGETPILLTGRVKVGPTSNVDVSVNVAPGTIQDISALVMEIAKGM